MCIRILSCVVRMKRSARANLDHSCTFYRLPPPPLVSLDDLSSSACWQSGQRRCREQVRNVPRKIPIASQPVHAHAHAHGPSEFCCALPRSPDLRRLPYIRHEHGTKCQRQRQRLLRGLQSPLGLSNSREREREREQTSGWTKTNKDLPLPGWSRGHRCCL